MESYVQLQFNCNRNATIFTTWLVMAQDLFKRLLPETFVVENNLCHRDFKTNKYLLLLESMKKQRFGYFIICYSMALITSKRGPRQFESLSLKNLPNNGWWKNTDVVVEFNIRDNLTRTLNLESRKFRQSVDSLIFLMQHDSNVRFTLYFKFCQEVHGPFSQIFIYISSKNLELAENIALLLKEGSYFQRRLDATFEKKYNYERRNMSFGAL